MDKAQLRAARALLGWTQDDLAKAAGVSVPTVRRLETGDGDIVGAPEMIEKIRNALTDNNIVFVDRLPGSDFPGLGVWLNRKTIPQRYATIRFLLSDAAKLIVDANRLDDSRERIAILSECLKQIRAVQASLFEAEREAIRGDVTRLHD